MMTLTATITHADQSTSGFEGSSDNGVVLVAVFRSWLDRVSRVDGAGIVESAADALARETFDPTPAQPAPRPGPRLVELVPPSDRGAKRAALERTVLAIGTPDGQRMLELTHGVMARLPWATTYQVQEACTRLEAAGRLTRYGQTSGRMVRLVVPDSDTVRIARPVPAHVTVTPLDRLARRARLIDAFARVLAAASRPCTMRDFAPAAKDAAPDWTVAELSEALDQMVREGRAGVSTVGLERRYSARTPAATCV